MSPFGTADAMASSRLTLPSPVKPSAGVTAWKVKDVRAWMEIDQRTCRANRIARPHKLDHEVPI